jgi:hypothetical protein
MEKYLNVSRDQLAVRQRAFQVTDVLAGTWCVPAAGIPRRLGGSGGAVRLQPARTAVPTPVPGLSPGGHPT